MAKEQRTLPKGTFMGLAWLVRQQSISQIFWRFNFMWRCFEIILAPISCLKFACVPVKSRKGHLCLTGARMCHVMPGNIVVSLISIFRQEKCHLDLIQEWLVAYYCWYVYFVCWFLSCIVRYCFVKSFTPFRETFIDFKVS